MAIAPLPEVQAFELFENPWPRPVLRVVTDPHDRQAREEVAPERHAWKTGVDVAQRRAERAHRRVIRRRVVVGFAVAVAIIVMALPLRALGTVTISGQQTPGGLPSGLMDGTVYVVQPGDTLAGIAHQLNPTANQKSLVAQMAKELGSSTVVAGEHVLLP